MTSSHPPSLSRSAGPSDLEHRLIAALQRLNALDIDRQDVNTRDVDGIFYWEVARTDLIGRVAALRANTSIVNEQDIGTVSSALADIWIDFGIPHHAAWAHVSRGALLAVREANIKTSASATNPLVDERLIVDVRSAGWSGRHVSEAIKKYVGWNERLGATRLELPWRDGDATELRIRFSPVPAGRGVCSSAPVDRLEEIRVEIWLAPDLPEPDLIGDAYDRIVRDHRQWHRHLIDAPAASDAQTPRVAARTWIVALLFAAGETFEKAMSFAKWYCGLDRTADSGFRREKARLLTRVPEAEPYLERS